MSDQTAAPNDPLWSQLTGEGRKARYEIIEHRHKQFIDLMQKQVEIIGKYLLLINAGGAAAVLAAISQETELHLQWTLFWFVVSIVLVGFALASSYYLYDAAIKELSAAFNKHVNDESGWIGLNKAMEPRSWKGFRGILARVTNLIYWTPLLCFMIGAILGGRQMLLN